MNQLSSTTPVDASIHKHRDPTSLANYEAWRTQHTAVDLRIDFENQTLSGRVKHSLKPTTDTESEQIVLDTSYLDVREVKVNGSNNDFNVLPRHEAYGSALVIPLKSATKKGQMVEVDIACATTKDCTALQWLTPAQTSSKKHPYMFSQCQAIHARSVFPCQDTPDVKATFDFRLQSPLQVLASGLAKGTEDIPNSTDKVYVYHQPVPLPSYLFAIASGELVSAQIGPRSKVWTGPNELEAAKWELDQEPEKFLQVVEKILFPYVWGTYDVLVLPPSFPYGGMENPMYTFLTPTTISGDKENIDVVAHEACHSWSGNLVTTASPEHPWLNEGWTVYLERRIVRALHGDAAHDFSAIIGWKGLEDSVARLGPDHEYTKLIVKLDGGDPDDAYSIVQYEKGFCLLYQLEQLLGRDEFDKFARHYFETWKYRSLDSYDFKATFIDYFSGDNSNDLTIMRLRTFDWDRWFYQPGLPPKPRFDTTMADVCYALAAKWRAGAYTPAPDDIRGWTSSQVVVFLEAVQQFAQPLAPAAAAQMGAAYALTHSANAEVASRYYVVALRAGERGAVQPAAEFLGRVGRMKFVRPVYTWLNQVDRELALKTFEAHRDFYHPICRRMVEKMLYEGKVSAI